MERRGSEPFIELMQVLQIENYPNEMLRGLDSLRAEATLTDTILCVGLEEFPCHRNVLAVSSPYFKAMFSCSLRESREPKIVFSEISGKTLGQLIDFIYTGRLEITVDNAQDMLAAGSLFQFPKVVDFCCNFLSKHLHPSNCLGIEEFSHLHSCAKLEIEAHNFCVENFTAVVEYEEFLELPSVRLLTYIASESIDVRTEEFVFEAVVKWLEYKFEERKDSACALMTHIRFTSIDADYIKQKILPHSCILLCAKCTALVTLNFNKRFVDGLPSEGSSSDHSEKPCSQQLPRPSTLAKEVIVLLGVSFQENNKTTTLEVYDPVKERWSNLSENPPLILGSSVVAVGNDIYITGGIKDNVVVGNVWKFTSASQKWNEMEPLLVPRAYHASAAWNLKLYVIGGAKVPVLRNADAIETIECLDISMINPTWKVVSQLPCPRIQSHAISYNATLIEIGGTQCGAAVKRMENYLCNDTSVKNSGEQFVLPEPIEFSKIAVIDGIFYIIWEDSRKVISLNPDKRIFRQLADMHTAHVHGGMAVVNKSIYMAGGKMNSIPHRTVECYDPTKDVWTIVKSTRACWSEVHCATIKMC